ncbi:MAG: hypothetical protein HY744_33375 [Deltaproteobacteria bacterium]|nr:hypothetical protein [Deltaproteobacteria bacterium]
MSLLMPTRSVAAVLLLGLAGCQSSASPARADASAATASAAGATATTSASAVALLPGVELPAAGVPRDEVVHTLDPLGTPPYSGPTATMRGTVRVTGDEPPPYPRAIPVECSAAAATHGKLFRTGQDHALADVLVAVTGYDGFVPPREAARRLTIRGCALSARTVALTFGQYLEVQNLDALRSYVPHLEGSRAAAALVAVPRGDPVKLYVRQPGRYWLRDQMGKPWLGADVFVLRYATVDVTGLDGRYEIGGVPVGKVHVAALLPAANMKTAQRDVELKPGENTLDLTIEFDAKKDAPGAAPDGGAADGGEQARPGNP